MSRLRARRRVVTVVASLVVTLAMALASPRPVGAAETDDVRAATQAWADAFNSREPARVQALYAPDAVFLGTSSPVLRDSPALIAEYFRGLPNRVNERVELGDYRIRVYGDVAVSSGFYTFTDRRPDGEPVRRPARFSIVFHLVQGRWLIVEHHSSSLPGGAPAAPAGAPAAPTAPAVPAAPAPPASGTVR